MALSWNEIKDRALAFSKEWEYESSEHAEANTFWDGFFNIFGVTRRRLASFQEAVKKAGGGQGFIDLFWKGVLLVEHKSRGKNLDRAYGQAIDYFPGIKERDLPRYILVSDFANFRLYDLETGEQHEFPLKDLHKHTKRFAFIAGYETRVFDKEDPVNIKAAEQLGKLHDQLREVGYEGHPLEVFLVRILFCLFADDTGIFEQRGQFREYIEQRTAEDGSDLGALLAQLFQVLNTPTQKRLRTLDEHLAAFPYVNGKLFEESLPIAALNRKMRETLLDCAGLDWSRISPAIFGSLFQSIMDKKARRNLGAHYTREVNILKALQPLFLDGLRAEFEQLRRSPKRLVEFQRKLANIRVLDPACGCGNFLVIAYRELRELELDVLRELHKAGQSRVLDVSHLLLVDVDQFYGIEIEEFPAQIAQVALWLTDHQMNLRVSEEFGQYFARLPLKKAPNIVHGNALTIDWRTVVAPAELSYIVGNPPFIGHQWRSREQMDDMSRIWGDEGRFGRLDYVTCWHRIAADFMQANPAIQTALVSTNSITQGEQVGILWPELCKRGVRINFAHRTFQWSSEAKGKAAVHCVIIGFGLVDTPQKWIFEYETVRAEPHVIQAKRINSYLVDAPNVFLPSRTMAPPGFPEMKKGSQPTDGGYLILDEEEKKALVKVEPAASKFIRQYIGGDEFISGVSRWCLWLKDASPAELKAMPKVLARVEGVRQSRLKSPTASVREYAKYPTLFTQDRQPSTDYLAVPEVSSENRRFIPMGFLPPSVIASNKLQMLVGATMYHFGVLTSTMHMAWMRAVCGRLESRYSYAPSVYNTFPWPDPSDKHTAAIEAAAQRILAARAGFPTASLAELYDPLVMPATLSRAHQALDRAVDAAYGKSSFASETERVAFLFERYEKLNSLLPPTAAKKPLTAKTADV